MTREEMERTIEFLLEHHAKFSGDIDRLKELQERTTSDIQSLAEIVARVESQAEADRREMRVSVDSVIEEMRDNFNKLILSNEVTRDLSENVARLAIATIQRATVLEETLK